MFITAVFTTAKLEKKSKYTTNNEWVTKMQYIYTTEYYSATKTNEIMLIAGKWMELEIFMLSEKNQAQKDKYHMFSLMVRI
jgi:hypothetical protein